MVEHSKWKLYEDHDNLVRKFAWNMIRSCRVKGDNAPEPDLLAEADVCDEVATAIWNKVFKAYSAGNYKDRGYKITAWIGTIARNYCTAPLSKLGFELNFLNWIIESHYCFYAGARPVRGTRWDGSGSKENGTVRLGRDYGRTMRVWVLLPSFLNSVRRKSKNSRDSGRPELRSRASRKTKTSAFNASLSRRWGSPISRPSSS